MEYIISEEQDGMLLKTYLRTVCRISSRLLSRLKQTPNGILLDGKSVTVRAHLRQGSHLSLAIEDSATVLATSIVPSALPLKILYEDKHILLCDKPADMPTHPSHGHFDDTLANAVAAYDLSMGRPPFVFRPINRLDRNTGGIVLIARTQLAASRLSEDMRQGKIQKTYYALLCGRLPQSQGEISTGIRRVHQSVILREVCDIGEPDAIPACTRYKTVATWTGADGSVRTLVMAMPVTGRTHQLRLHFAANGAPIVGDALYGYGEIEGLRGHALHAETLSFFHPVTEIPMTVSAQLPPDFLSLIPAEYQSKLDKNNQTLIFSMK